MRYDGCTQGMNILHLAHHWLVPHESNNHRSRALHLNALLSYALLLMVFNLGVRVLHSQAPDVLGYATDIRVDQLLNSTNAKRQESGLSSLRLNDTLSQAAAAKAADMFANNYWAHNSPSGKTPWDFVNASGYKYTLAGENLAKNFQTSDGVVDAWMASPTHRANVLKPGYADVGFAIVNGVLSGEETTLVVQMFGASRSVAVPNVDKVQAQEPVVVKTVVPEEPVAQAAIPEPTVTLAVPEPLAPAQLAPQVSSVITNPLINLSAVSRQVVFVFAGILMGILAIDAYVVARRRVVRLAGHNLAHILFLFSIVIGGLFLTHGALL